MKTAQKLLLTIILVLGFLVLPKQAFASNLYLTPASGSVGVGQTLAVQVRIDTAGVAVNGVTAVISYPADKLDVAYVTPGTAFSIEAEKAIGGGSIKISRGNINGVTGNVTVATIGFRGKSLGQANIQFGPGSAAPNATNSSDTLNYSANKSSTINVVAASVTATPASKVGPVISGLEVVDVSSNSATVNWKTDKASDSTVEYGVDPNQFVLNTNASQRVTEHSVKLENLSFAPGTKLYLRVKSKDAGGAESVSEVTSFSTKGYRVIIKITDQNSQPLSNIKATLYSDPMESATNDQGQVTYEDITPGNHILLVQNGTLEKSYDLEVVDNGDLSTPQEFTFQFDSANSTTSRQAINLKSKNTWAMIILGLSLLILALIAIYILKKRQGGGGTNGPTSSDSGSFPFFQGNSQTPSNPTPTVFHPGQ